MFITPLNGLPTGNITTENETLNQVISKAVETVSGASKKSKTKQGALDGIKRLKQLVSATEKNFWAIGDQASYLHQQGINAKQMAKETGWSQARISGYKCTAEVFKGEIRNRESTYFWDFEKARAAEDRRNRMARKRLKTANPQLAAVLTPFSTVDYAKALDSIQAEEAKSGKKLNKREATNHLIKEVKAAITSITPKIKQDNGLLNHCYNKTNEQLLTDWKSENVHLTVKFHVIHMDPPYWYKKHKHKNGLTTNISAASHIGSICLKPQETIDSTAATLRLCPDFLEVNGVIFLWTTCTELPIEILNALADSNLEVETCVVWVKKRTQPSDFDMAWAPNSEFCWVIKRKGDELANHTNSENTDHRGNVLDAENPEFWFEDGSQNLEDNHWWQKPIGLIEFLIRKATNEGANVLDLFACTGSASKAAIRSKRNFVYCEGHETNFTDFHNSVLLEMKKASESEAPTSDDQAAGAIAAA